MKRIVGLLALCAAVLAAARFTGRIDEARILPNDHPAIGYSTARGDDAVSRLQRRLDSGEVRLEFDRRFGYLPDVLKKLDLPISSQALVFSKTSFQAVRIMPRIPRAIYHREDVTVGFVRGGDVLELTTQDPVMGTVFYTLDQVETMRPQFLRRSECVSCHLGPATSGVPGLLVRSVYVERSGMPMAFTKGYISDHRSPLSERWGGWYVSGTSGDQTHMGNLVLDRGQSVEGLDLRATSNVEDLKPHVDTGAYLGPDSDIVSLMVLEHQTRMANLLTRVGYEARIALHDQGVETLDELSEDERETVHQAIEELLRYMLFTDEKRLDSPVKGTSEFAEEFSARGKLYELDLETRLMRYPCSYMVYSPGFVGLPATVKARIYERLGEILTAEQPEGDFAVLTAEDRRAVLEILAETKAQEIRAAGLSWR